MFSRFRYAMYLFLAWITPDEERYERRKVQKQARRDFYREEAQ